MIEIRFEIFVIFRDARGCEEIEERYKEAEEEGG